MDDWFSPLMTTVSGLLSVAIGSKLSLAGRYQTCFSHKSQLRPSLCLYGQVVVAIDERLKPYDLSSLADKRLSRNSNVRRQKTQYSESLN